MRTHPSKIYGQRIEKDFDESLDWELLLKARGLVFWNNQPIVGWTPPEYIVDKEIRIRSESMARWTGPFERIILAPYAHLKRHCGLVEWLSHSIDILLHMIEICGRDVCWINRNFWRWNRCECGLLYRWWSTINKNRISRIHYTSLIVWKSV